MSLNYSFYETLKLLIQAFKYNMFISIIISSLIFFVVLVMNKDKKFIIPIILVLNISIIFIVLYYYFNQILSFNFNNFINNIYFYFFNSIIFFIIFSIVFVKIKYKKINFIFYTLALINILFSVFMTHYLRDTGIMVFLNIYPMVKFGNIIYFAYYIFILLSSLTKKM